MTPRLAVGTLVVAAALAAAGPGCRCGGPGADGGIGADAGNLPDGFETFAAAACEYVDRCAGEMGRGFDDAGDCVRWYLDFYECFVFPFLGALGGAVTLDPAALDDCVDAIEAAACDAPPATLAACENVFVATPGSLAEGEPCAMGSLFLVDACADGLYCRIEFGTCSACTREAVEGEDCSTRECGDGLRCVSPGLTCMPLVADGLPCSFDDDCASDICTMNVCMPPQGAGAPCDSSNDCVSDRCVAGACVDPVGEGGPCMEDTECAGYLTCQGAVCASRGGAGAPCTDGADCYYDHWCLGGTCTPGDFCAGAPIGTSCGLDAALVLCALPGYCDGTTGLCTAAVPDGGACTESQQCLDDSTCRGAPMVCTPDAPVGGACQIDFDCLCHESDCTPRTYCDTNGTCQERTPDGTPCSTEDSCISDYCDAMTGACAPFPTCPAL